MHEMHKEINVDIAIADKKSYKMSSVMYTTVCFISSQIYRIENNINQKSINLRNKLRNQVTCGSIIRQDRTSP
jgi:hypothetical protein